MDPLILQQFIDALRNELQQYGEILALLEQQQQVVLRQGNEEIQQSVAAIDRQQAVIATARHQRQTIQRELARCLDQAPTATFAQFIPRLPEPYRPLVKALVVENHELLHRVEQRAQQNQAMLQRSLHLMQEFMDNLMPIAQAALPPLCPSPPKDTPLPETIC